MRRLGLMVACGVVLAGPAMAFDAVGMVEMINRDCAKPVGQLSLGQLEDCRQMLRVWKQADPAADESKRPTGTVTIYRSSRIGR